MLYKDLFGFGEEYRKVIPTHQKAVHQAATNCPRWVRKLILFGSCANGEAWYGSDIDLMIISDEEVTPEQMKEFRSTLDETFEYDLIYLDLQSYLEDTGMFSVVYMANTEGMVLYEKTDTTG